MSTYSLQRTGDHACSVLFSGDLTAASVPALQTDLKQQLESSVSEMVFDLTGASMLDSSGIGLLIAAANSLARKAGKVRVVNASADVFQLLQSMRLTSRLNVSARSA